MIGWQGPCGAGGWVADGPGAGDAGGGVADGPCCAAE